jgi:hypothetical protein
MVITRGAARLGMLAVGLGIGAAVAHTPVASADSSGDWLSSIDSVLSGGALPAPATSLDYQISIDGYDLFPTAGNTATATSGIGDIAIAYGDDADASAVGGFGDDAYAGAGATAVAGDLNTGATGNNFDFASATGGGSEAVAGNGGAPDTTGSSFDFASANGVSSFAVAGQNGSGDVASAVGPVSALSGGSNNATDPANFDYASALDTTNTTSALGTQAVAGGGFSDLGGSNDTAFVIDPSGTVGSTADAGLGFNSDLAAAFGDAFNAIATGADNLFNILGLS